MARQVVAQNDGLSHCPTCNVHRQCATCGAEHPQGVTWASAFKIGIAVALISIIGEFIGVAFAALTAIGEVIGG